MTGHLAQSTQVMASLRLDLVRAFRSLRRTPGFLAAAVLTLALGIGANTAVFSLVYEVLLKPLPCPRPERLVAVTVEDMVRKQEAALSSPTFFDLQERARTFESMAAYRFETVDFSVEGRPARLLAARVTADFLRTFGATPALGRGFAAQDGRIGRPLLAVLSHGLWTRRFGADPGVLGRTVRLDGREHEIIGVLSDRTLLPVGNPPDLLVPEFRETGDQDRGNLSFTGVARLRDGFSLTQARTELSQLSALLASEHPRYNQDLRCLAAPLRRSLTEGGRSPLLFLLGTVLLVLLVACVNVANLFLARAIQRGRESALRVSLGAGNGAMLRHCLAEGLIASLGGALIGLGLARLLMGTLSRFLPAVMQTGIPVDLSLSWVSLAFTGLVLGLATLVFALVPVLHTRRLDLVAALREQDRGSLGSGARRWRSALVVAQLSTSLVLVMACGLLLRSFVNVLDTPPGFDPAQVLTFNLAMPEARYPDEQARARFLQDLRAGLRELPGVQSAGLASQIPMDGNVNRFSFQRNGVPGHRAVARGAFVSPGYAETLRIALKAGRFFRETDTLDAPRVVVVNEALARRDFPGEDPIGKTFRTSASLHSPRGTPWEIVGVVGNVRLDSLEQETEPEFWMCTAQNSEPGTQVVVRTGGKAESLRGSLEAVVQRLDGDLAVAGLREMSALLQGTLGTRRLLLALLGAFAALALGLAALGLYAVLASTVVQRRREFGLRMALGARIGSILGLVLGQGMGLVLTGGLLGLGGTLLLARFLGSQLHAVPALDLPSFLAAFVTLAVAALLACLVPALRATAVDPAVVLRGD